MSTQFLGRPGPWALFATCVVAAAMLLASCGGGSGGNGGRGTPSPSVTVTSAAPTGTPGTPVPLSELKVAFINLYSPLTLDANDPAAADTFKARIQLLAEELRKLQPDLIAFNEASVTSHGNAIEMLVAELKMEYYYTRANPWFPGQSKEQSDATVKQIGFEEGELLLSRFPILTADEPLPLNPLTSESGERRVLLHAVVKAPAPLGEIDVYVTHLTGGGEATRQAQAADVVQKLKDRDSGRPTFIIGDMTDPAGSATYKVFEDAGFADPLGDQGLATCCRKSVVGDQSAATTRPDWILARGLGGGTVQLFAQDPAVQPDMRKLYASDHNGLFAVFTLGP